MRQGLILLLFLFPVPMLGVAQVSQPMPWLYHVARAHLVHGDPAATVLALDSLATTGWRLPYEAYRLYTLAYLRMGCTDSAEYYIGLAAQPGSYRHLLLAAQVACQQGRIAEGIGYLQAYVGSKGALAERKLWADTLLRPCRDTAAWQALWLGASYSISQQLDDDLQQRAEEGNWHYLLERLEQMSPYAQQRPKYAHLHAMALQGLRDYPEALKVALTNAKRNPRQESYVLLAAELAQQNGKANLAVHLVEKYLGYDPHTPSMLPVLAESLLALGESRRAFAAAHRYLELYPQHGRSLFVAACAAAQAGIWIPALQAVARLMPRATADTAARLRTLRARAMLATGRPRLALDELQSARVVLPADTMLLALLARAHGQLGDRAAMCRALNEAARQGHRAAQRELMGKCPRRIQPVE